MSVGIMDKNSGRIGIITGVRMAEIPDFPNYYITEDGRVWSEWRKHFLSEIIMPKGYHRVVLSKNNKSYNFLVHRLVAEAFVPNPNKKPCVNHIDCNPENNHYSNLEWVTHKENNNYAEHGRKNGLAHAKAVYQIDPKTDQRIAYFESAREAAKSLNIRATNIGAVCNHKPHYLTAGGYKWEWAGGDGKK